MRISRTFKALCLATVISLAATAPALGASAGDEYVPKVPSAAGDEAAASDSGGSGTAGVAPVTGSTGGKFSKGKKQGKDSGPQAGATPTEAGSSGDDSSGVLDTLLDPIVLLLIAGVIVTALGMTLRRKQGGDEDAKAARAPRDPATTPPTPDGEIVAGGGGEQHP